jgi:hypothetical protein
MKRTGRREWIFITGHCTSLKKNAYCIHLSSEKDVKILMAYMVDLICVMQVIFLLASGDRVKPETPVLALRAYEEPRRIVQSCVNGFDGRLGVLPGGRELVLDEMERLIWRYRIADHEIEELRRQISGISPSGSS